MIDLIGGSPRSGKSTLCQEFAAAQRLGWMSTDVIRQLLPERSGASWDASVDAILGTAQWFYPYLEKLVWGVSSLSPGYVIEGVEILPSQASQLSKRFEIRSVFLGCSTMTLERFDRYPGKSPGYAALDTSIRKTMAKDIPVWSDVVRRQAEASGWPYFDVAKSFHAQMGAASETLLG